MAPHSSTLAWKIPWMEEPGRLQSMGSLGVRHNWAASLWLFTFMHWRRKWQPTPVFLPGESQGRGSRVGCRPWGRTELATKRLSSSSKEPRGLPTESDGPLTTHTILLEYQMSAGITHITTISGNLWKPFHVININYYASCTTVITIHLYIAFLTRLCVP